MKDKKWLLTPQVTAHCTGQRYPKDIYYRQKYHDKPKYRITLCMPDGFLLSIPLFEGENLKDKVKDYLDNWYKVTKAQSDLFEHFTIKEKCPRCGGELRSKINKKCVSVWCINHPACDYQDVAEGLKARQIICEKHGIKCETVHKVGVATILTNKLPKK